MSASAAAPPRQSPPTGVYRFRDTDDRVIYDGRQRTCLTASAIFCVPTDTEPEDLCDGAYGGGVEWTGGERDGIAAA